MRYLNSVPDYSLQKDTISTEVDIVPIMPGVSPDTQGFTRKIEEEKRKQAAAPQGSWLSRNWMYVGIAVFLLINLGGGAGQ